jgi:hypothetical protein
MPTPRARTKGDHEGERQHSGQLPRQRGPQDAPGVAQVEQLPHVPEVLGRRRSLPTSIAIQGGVFTQFSQRSIRRPLPC